MTSFLGNGSFALPQETRDLIERDISSMHLALEREHAIALAWQLAVLLQISKSLQTHEDFVYQKISGLEFLFFTRYLRFRLIFSYKIFIVLQRF